MTEECWRPMVGWEGLYEVSDAGRVRSFRVKGNGLATRTDPRIIVGAIGSHGYRYVHLRRDRKSFFKLVHAVVLEAFVGARPLKHDGAHSNGNRTDNRLCNLRWATRHENLLDRRAHGTSRASAKLTVEAVREIRGSSASYRQLATLHGVSRGCIQQVKEWRNWKDVI